MALSLIPPEHRAIEMERLFGGAGEPGAIPWLLRREMGEGPLRERLVEHAFVSALRLDEGPRGESPWYVRVHGRIDRADVDHKGRLHVYDYKSGRAPGESVSLQVPLYAMCLASERGADVNVRVWADQGPSSSGRSRGEWRTPLGMARQSGHDAVVQFLVSAGARE